MNGSRWLTKQDVLNDLSATGHRITDFDENFIVRGQKPPPLQRYMDDEDDEILLRYGRIDTKVNNNDMKPPDLEGITKMLRMVEKTSSNERPQEATDSEESPSRSHRIVISKLNPHVREFVPKSTVNEQNNNTNNIVETSESKYKSSFSKNETSESKDKLTFEKEETLEIKEELKIEAMLKNKIKETAKAVTIKDKRARNVAIAALMKLKSAPPRSDSPTITPSSTSSRLVSSESNTNSIAELSSSPAKPIVLLSPEYFEAPKVTILNIEDDEHQIPNISPCSENNICNTEEEDSVNNTPISKPSSPTESKILLHDPDIQESINKVNKWLETPEKTKHKPIGPQMGPIVYRKKGTSPNFPIPNTVKSKPVGVTAAFVPSKYAQDLLQTYNERAKAKEAQVDIWTKLEKDLKAKDEIIKQRLSEGKNDSSSQNTSCSSSISSSRRK